MSEFRSCVKVDVAVLGSLSLRVLMASVDLKQHQKEKKLSVSEFRGCVKVDVRQH